MMFQKTCSSMFIKCDGTGRSMLSCEQLCYCRLFISARFASAREFSYIFSCNRGFSFIGHHESIYRTMLGLPRYMPPIHTHQSECMGRQKVPETLSSHRPRTAYRDRKIALISFDSRYYIPAVKCSSRYIRIF